MTSTMLIMNRTRRNLSTTQWAKTFAPSVFPPTRKHSKGEMSSPGHLTINDLWRWTEDRLGQGKTVCSTNRRALKSIGPMLYAKLSNDIARREKPLICSMHIAALLGRHCAHLCFGQDIEAVNAPDFSSRSVEQSVMERAFSSIS